LKLSDLFRKRRFCPHCDGELEEYDRPDGFIMEIGAGVKRAWKLIFARSLGMDEDRMLDKEGCSFVRCQDCGRVFRS